jgi:hypothetical protein
MLDLKSHLADADVDLRFARQTRKALVNSIVAAAGEDLGKMHSEKIGALGSLLRDMDHAAIQLAKLKVDDTAANANAQAAGLIAALLDQGGLKAIGRVENGAARSAPQLDESTVEVSMAPDEMTIGVPAMNYDSFMASQKKK